MKNKTKNVPASALQCSIGVFELGSNGEDAKSAPITMTARSGKPVEHPFWGRIIHDFEGMTLHKERLAIDYCHDQKEPIGYLNKFKTQTGDLVCSGALTPYKDNDRANEVIYKSGRGIPYEASIYWGGDGIVLEEIGENQTTTVNNREFVGPGVVVRKWPLRGVAVCVYGADMNTESKFSDGQQVSVTFTSNSEISDMKDKELSEETTKVVETGVTPKAEAVKAVEAKSSDEATQEAHTDDAVDSDQENDQGNTTPPTDATEHIATNEPGKKFMDAFGEQQGALYFAKGMSFENAQAAHIDHLQSQVNDLQTKVKNDRGVEPVEFEAATETTTTTSDDTLAKLTKAFGGDEKRALKVLEARKKKCGQ